MLTFHIIAVVIIGIGIIRAQRKARNAIGVMRRKGC